ncbi:MAG: AgmX/PglI C-terminal domain-containing protein [Nevskia sp.]|nr:AgmX/PglI C-terminal domain-containing protein [Nevskia sp.]
MSVQAIRWESWALAEEADRRFRRIVLMVATPALILAILLSIFQMQTKKAETGTYNGARYAELVAEQPGEVAPPEQPKPAPKNEPEKPQQAAPPKPVQKPTPQPVPQPSARELAQKTQEMKVIQDQLKDLRDQNLNTLSDQPLVSNVISSKGGVGGSGASAEAIAASAAANSGNGIGGVGSVTSTQSGTGLGSRRTGTVHSSLGFGRDVSKAGANGKVDNGRSIQEVQEIFDRNKAGFNSIYNRAARENPSISAGQIVVHLVIAPDGSVSQCTVISSSFNDPDFEQKVVQRIKLLNFGSKSVPPFDVAHYPINFQPM